MSYLAAGVALTLFFLVDSLVVLLLAGADPWGVIKIVPLALVGGALGAPLLLRVREHSRSRRRSASP